MHARCWVQALFWSCVHAVVANVYTSLNCNTLMSFKHAYKRIPRDQLTNSTAQIYERH